MKKFLIVVICFIPLVLVLALNGAAKAVAIRTPDNPNIIEIRNEQNRIIKEDDVITLDLFDLEKFIIIKILPEMTKNKNIAQPEILADSNGDIAIEQIENTNRYKLIPKRSGAVEMVIAAEANINLKRKLTFFIESNKIEEIHIMDSQRNHLGSHMTTSTVESSKVKTIKPSAATYKLSYEVYPFNALNQNRINWEVYPANSLDISINGDISVNEREKVDIGIIATGKDGQYVKDNVIIDFSNAFVKKTLAYTIDKVDVAWVKKNLIFKEVASEVTINQKSGTIFEASYMGESIDITVYGNQTDPYIFVDNISKIYTNNMVNQLLIARTDIMEISDYEDNKNPNYLDVKFSSSNADIMDVHREKGLLIPKKAGKCTIKAEFNKTNISKEIEVREIKEYFSLKLGYIDQHRGVRQDRIWATKFYKGGESTSLAWDKRIEQMKVDSTYEFCISKDDASCDIIWEFDKPEIIKVNRKYPYGQKNDILIEFLESGAGKEVTLTAYMSIDGQYKVERMQKSFTFKIIDDPNAINVTNSLQIEKSRRDKVKNIVFQDDIIHDADTFDRIITSYANIWGNGFLITQIVGNNNSSVRALLSSDGSRGFDADGKVVKDDQLIFDDFTIHSMQNIDEKEYMEKAGNGVSIHAIPVPVILRYLQIRNCNIGIEARSVPNILVEGCLVGDNKFLGMIMYNDWHEGIDNEKAVIKNSVFTNSLGPSVLVLFNDFKTVNDTYGKNILQQVYFEGDVRIYNWKSRSVINSFVDVILSQYIGDDKEIEPLKNLIAPFWESIMKQKEWDNMFMWYKGQEYASFGLFIYGITAKNNLENLHVGNDYAKYLVPLVNSKSSSLMSLLKVAMYAAAKISLEEVYDSFLVGYDFSKNTPKIMPLEPVPQSYDMYASLIGDTVADYSF